MGGFWGQDIEQVRRLAQALNQGGETIEQLSQQLSGQLDGTQWTGPDAERFRGDWSGQYRAQLTQVATVIREAGTAADKNAQEQETASQS